MAHVGDRIRLARGARAKAALARDLSVDVKTLYRWEHGDAQPSSAQLVPLADTLGVSVRWLLTGEGDGPAALEPTGTEG